MSPAAMLSESRFTPLFEALRAAPTAPDAKAAADRIARDVSKFGLQCLEDEGIFMTLHEFATNKKSGYERESAAIALQSLASILGASAAPLFLPSLPILFDQYMDKGDVVRIAATSAVKTILKLFPPESTPILFRALENILSSGKWKTKVGVLDSFKVFVSSAPDVVALDLVNVLPKVEAAMHDTKQEGICAVIATQYNVLATPRNWCY